MPIPSYFERAGLQRVGGSGDGGIDGIISLDRLGLEKVYVQAKRWQNTVGRPEVQGFFGALAGRRATKGVFITTSAFTRDAREFAQQVSDSIVLVDGSHVATAHMEVAETHHAHDRARRRRHPQGSQAAARGQRLLRRGLSGRR